MKTTILLAFSLAVILSGGCGFSPTKVKVRVVEHKAEAGGAYYALLYEVLEPKNLAGRYGIAATRRGDLVASVNDGEFEIYLNFTMVGPLGNKPLPGYETSPPQSKRDDFLEMAKRVKQQPPRRSPVR
jgi:hypothetical protein